MKRYYIDWKTIVIVSVIGFILLISDSISKYPDRVVLSADISFLLFFTLILIIITKYSYAEISGSTLRFVYTLYIRRTISIYSITEINDQPTYKIGGNLFRSLYIFYKDKNGKIKWIELRITIFPERTLGKLIKDIKTINPKIELNKYAQGLMESVL